MAEPRIGAKTIRVYLVRTRPRDTIGALPLVIVFQAAPSGPPDTSPGYTRVYLTRARQTRHRKTRHFLRRFTIVAGTPPPPRTERVRVYRVRIRPRKTRTRLLAPQKITPKVLVDPRTVRLLRRIVRIRPRHTIAHVVHPVVVEFGVPPPPPPPPKVTRLRTTLGCGEYNVYIMSRGGQVFIGEVPWTSLQWGRVLDDTSQATVTAQVGLCSAVMAATKSWRHEMIVFRSGEQVWCGPVWQVVGDADAPQIVARDLSAWWDRRLVHNNHDYSDGGADLAVIFQEIHEDAMNVDNSPGFVLETSTTGILGAQQVFTDQRQMAGAFLRDVAQEGVDWTVVGRTAHAGGRSIPGVQIANILGDDHFVTPPRLTDDGSTKANREIVQGQGTDDNGFPIEGIAADANAALVDGVLEGVESISTIFTNENAAASAASKLAYNTEPFTMDEAILTPSAPVSMSDLIPGRLVNVVLNSTVVPRQGVLRLGSIDVNVDENGEAVGIICQPLGTQ